MFSLLIYRTILYELFVGWYPFYGSQPEHIIWKISNGYSQTLEDGQFPQVFKVCKRLVNKKLLFKGYQLTNFKSDNTTLDNLKQKTETKRNHYWHLVKKLILI